MDAAEWSQGIGLVKTMEGMLPSGCSRPMPEKKTRPKDQLNCPRCKSSNTKFCYYNNYSLTQPRYFCKACRRYWTQGGSLRNIPVGGGSRKNKKFNNTSPSSSSATKVRDLDSQSFPQLSPLNPRSQDFSLAIQTENNNNGRASYPVSATELLSTGFGSRGLSSFYPNLLPNTQFPSGISFIEFKPTPNVSSLDGFGISYKGQETGGRILFPFAEMKQVSSTTEADRNKGQGNSAGYWSGGMVGGKSW